MQLFLPGESPLEPQRMAAKSCKEPTDVWEPQQSSGKKKKGGGAGIPPVQRGTIYLHSLLNSTLNTGITAANSLPGHTFHHEVVWATCRSP